MSENKIIPEYKYTCHFQLRKEGYWDMSYFKELEDLTIEDVEKIKQNVDYLVNLYAERNGTFIKKDRIQEFWFQKIRSNPEPMSNITFFLLMMSQLLIISIACYLINKGVI